MDYNSFVVTETGSTDNSCDRLSLSNVTRKS